MPYRYALQLTSTVDGDFMKISPAEAVRQFNVSKPTLYEDMNSGKISYDTTKKGRRRIDVAELSRVYDPRERNETEANVRNSKSDTNSNVSREFVSVQVMERMLKQQKEQYEEQIATLSVALDKAQEGHNSATRLLGSDENARGESKTDELVLQLKKATEQSDKKFEAIMKRFEDDDRRREHARKRRQERKQQLEDEAARKKGPISRLANLFSTEKTKPLQKVS